MNIKTIVLALLVAIPALAAGAAAVSDSCGCPDCGCKHHCDC